MMFPDIFPLSLPAIINRVRRRYPVKGLFHWEMDSAEIRRARIIILDIHWYTMIKDAIRLSRQIKAVNPQVILIAGGLSASMFHRQLLRDGMLDYIIRGDGDRPLLDLVTAILENTPVESVPNVVGRGFESSNWYALTQEDFDDGNYRDITWFPTLEQRVKRYHRIFAKRPVPVHPVLASFRGCPVPCKDCLGGTAHQQHIFGRGCLTRNAARVQDDLLAYSADPETSFVYIYHDFLTMASGECMDRILDRRYDVHVYYEFFAVPTVENVTRLVNGFRGGTIFLPLDTMHNTSVCLGNTDDLIKALRLIRAHPAYEERLCYVKWGLEGDAGYADAFNRVVRETGCRVNQSDWWWEGHNPLPDHQGKISESVYSQCLENTNRFRLFNLMYRASVAAYGISPRLHRCLFRLYEKMNRPLPLSRC